MDKPSVDDRLKDVCRGCNACAAPSAAHIYIYIYIYTYIHALYLRNTDCLKLSGNSYNTRIDEYDASKQNTFIDVHERIIRMFVHLLRKSLQMYSSMAQRNVAQCRMRRAGCGMQDTACRMRHAGCGVQDAVRISFQLVSHDRKYAKI